MNGGFMFWLTHNHAAQRRGAFHRLSGAGVRALGHYDINGPDKRWEGRPPGFSKGTLRGGAAFRFQTAADRICSSGRADRQNVDVLDRVSPDQE